MQIVTEDNAISFISESGGVEVAAAVPADAGIDEVIRVFRGFLLATGYAAEITDQYLTPE